VTGALAIIPARGGSKRVPGKNLANVGGKPLIVWTVEAALAARTVARVIVSTDDTVLAETAASAGADVPFLRPAALSDDAATSADVVLHALDALDESYETAVLLQPTSPLRTAADIDDGLDRLAESGADTCVGVGPVEHRPDWYRTIDAHGRLRPAGAMADGAQGETLYMLNGALFAFRVAAFRADPRFITDETVGHPMPADRSLDIDTPFDLRVANLLFSTGARS
jgi:CMP-N,N'-diacetyllegionaminic acid synthase